ncbi:MAG: hypothetical protein SFT81_00380 [Candidatus Caenarcaniphilales bacterium]|nr:hypothetical protein [Candidatus Caenarcaniphilales bacterium]
MEDSIALKAALKDIKPTKAVIIMAANVASGLMRGAWEAVERGKYFKRKALFWTSLYHLKDLEYEILSMKSRPLNIYAKT